MTTGDATQSRSSGRAHGILAAALLSVTALVRVPMELYAVTIQDFSAASRDVVLAIFALGIAFFLLLVLLILLLPRRWRGGAATALVGASVYAWIRSGFFPGPSVSLNGVASTTDLSTGLAGLLVPLAGGVILAWLGTRQARITTTFLSVLLCGSVLRAGEMAASTWNVISPPPESAALSLVEWSRHGNVIILILDSLQSDVFDEIVLNRPALGRQLDGFRYYRQASSSSPTTYLSLPTIHSGRVYDPRLSVVDFFVDAIREHSVLNRFAAAGYRVSCAMDGATCPKAVGNCLGVAALTRSRLGGGVEDAARLVDLGIYRVLPDGPRRLILERARGPLGAAVRWLTNRSAADIAAFRHIVTASIASDSPPTAKVIHTMVAHPPFVLQEDCSVGEPVEGRAAALRHATCALNQVGDFLTRLKALGVYDVSNIVITADHGYGIDSRFVVDTEDLEFKRRVGAFNPLVLTKPAQSRGPLEASDAPIELADLAGALCQEQGCSPSPGLTNLANVDVGRERVAFWYVWKHQYWKLSHIPGLIRYTIRGDLRKRESWSEEASP